jgi:hydrocephalus-inducing protein
VFVCVVAAAKSNVLKFGDCRINEPRTLALTMSNRSDQSVRFAWPDLAHLKFSPRIGHLHAGSTKDVSVTFKVDRPTRFVATEVACRVVNITFDRPSDEAADWDDRLKTVKWVAASQHPSLSSDGSAFVAWFRIVFSFMH